MGVISHNPKLWYYMSLCTLNINKNLYQQSEETASHSEVYHQKLGYQIPTYVKSSESMKHKRFLLAGKADPIQKMEQITRDFESLQTEEQKK
tara:strand:- start:195 stop:470 length:276 start_codon:yes stop_codon:yes gene_type:complete